MVSGRRRPLEVRPRSWCSLSARLGDKYQVDELAGKYEFTGHTPLTVPEALEVKEELETIDQLLKQLEEAAKTAQIGIIDLEELSQFAEPGDVEKLNELQQQIEELPAADGRAARPGARPEGLSAHAQGLSPVPGQAAGANLQQPASLAHRPASGPIVGEGAVELQHTKPYEFGDSVANMDMPGSFINAMIRGGAGLADPAEAGRHRDPPHAQHAQVRHGGADGHERLDALRRAVHQRQADGAWRSRA